MKKLAILVVAATMMAACGGGGIGGGSKSGLKTSGFFGRIPAIYADYALAEKAHRKEAEAFMKEIGLTQEMIDEGREDEVLKALDSKAQEKIMKRAEALDEKMQESRRLRDAALDTEKIKLAGKPVPFTVSDAFKRLNIEVLEARMCDDKIGFEARIVAKEDFEITRDNSRMYDYVCYREVAKDGSTIYAGLKKIRHSRGNIKKGWTMINEGSFGFYLTKHPEHYVDFERIEFINWEEYNKYNEEARIK